jgi:hypothetical protein
MMDDQTTPRQSLPPGTMALIPSGTPASVLAYLRRSYTDPNNRIAAGAPDWYRDALLARINALLEADDEMSA